MTKNDGDELILKTVKWMKSAYEAIYTSGGHPTYVLRDFPDELLTSLIRNDLYIKYDRFEKINM